MESCTRMFELTTSARSSFVRQLRQKVASPGARCVRPDAWCVVLATSHVQAMAAIRPRAYQTAARGGRKLRGSVPGGPGGAGRSPPGPPHVSKRFRTLETPHCRQSAPPAAGGSPAVRGRSTDLVGHGWTRSTPLSDHPNAQERVNESLQTNSAHPVLRACPLEISQIGNFFTRP